MKLPPLARPRRISLRARLTLTYGGLFFVAGLVLLGATYALFTQQLDRSGTRVLARVTTQQPGAPNGGDRTLVDMNGTSRTLPGAADATEDIERLMRRQHDEYQAAATTSMVTQGSIALLVVGGAAAGFGWLIAGRVLAPLHRVTETARRIARAPAADRVLHERIALRGPHDEVKELADTFDTMVERLDRSFDGQRRFVANASHELRTPLTLGRALVEVAMHRKAASPDLLRLGEDLLQITSRHERLIGGLLLLARSENEITGRAPVDLADVVAHVAARTAPEAAEAGITVTAAPGEAMTSGDALLLERVVENLVENGIRHNSGDGGWVRVTTAARDGRAVLEVANSGPPVPPYEVPGLFEPFRRLDADRVATAKGAGLGLSIVQSIVRAHDGDVTARPRPDGGLAVTVTLPAAPP
ncbi:sensor histidine kinase [Actinomadura verrucosospora]|uniref:histidine kinase n=1 Tax=Actinomadura verrucosospora TaxID=46165 RepID=A0A7D3ZM46_ACTVE|nr:HAMP domain-containing sensor histidine kinase [Actinomadura verrucosospora]QKG22023.1 integral membrane sensor signal transduction histidine kinase [Actinomadura verrucosospora]